MSLFDLFDIKGQCLNTKHPSVLVLTMTREYCLLIVVCMYVCTYVCMTNARVRTHAQTHSLLCTKCDTST